MAKQEKSNTPRRYRDARSGRFVTKKYARKNKKTTVTESMLRV